MVKCWGVVNGRSSNSYKVIYYVVGGFKGFVRVCSLIEDSGVGGMRGSDLREVVVFES